MDRLMGVILCGGNSRRMGQDKGLMTKGGVPWARYMADKLKPFDVPVVFSVNVSQVEAYSLQLPDARLVVDEVAVPGPLGGLLSVHTQFPDKDLLLLACDMIDMDATTIGRLVEAYLSGGVYAFFAYQEGEFFQPFCAIYTCGGLAAPHTAALEGSLEVISLQLLLRRGKTKILDIQHIEDFRNYNTL